MFQLLRTSCSNSQPRTGDVNLSTEAASFACFGGERAQPRNRLPSALGRCIFFNLIKNMDIEPRQGESVGKYTRVMASKQRQRRQCGLRKAWEKTGGQWPGQRTQISPMWPLSSFPLRLTEDPEEARALGAIEDGHGANRVYSLFRRESSSGYMIDRQSQGFCPQPHYLYLFTCSPKEDIVSSPE